jgi:16S rRNA (guanine527-N7)-methyltransferase
MVLPGTVSRETRARLHAFAETLTRWNATVNLVGKQEIGRLWPRHIADSLQLLPFLPAAGPLADLGSGAGFPGLILAIASGRHFNLVEADQRKAAFLREAARAAGADVTVLATRAETLAPMNAALITARAFAPLTRLLPIAARLLADDGLCLLLKGEAADAELTTAAREWQMKVRRWPSGTAPDAAILQVSDLKRHGA